MKQAIPLTLTFRDATLADLPLIVTIYNSTIACRMVTADTTPVSIESRINWFHSHDSTTRPLWMIHDQGQACGWISLTTFYGRPAYNKTVEVSLYLHEDYRGKKIGQQALQQIEQYAAQVGIETILSYIFGHNQPSLHLFSKMEYRQWGYLPKVAELDGVKRDLIILGKQLGKHFG